MLIVNRGPADSMGGSKLENVSERIPLLKGEGAAKRRVRGAEKRLFTPHPALRGTLLNFANWLKPAFCKVYG